MKIQLKINVVSLGILVAVAMAISLAGVLTIERLSEDLNRRLLSKELDTVIADVEAAHRVLVESGVDKVPSYVRSAQKETLTRLEEGKPRRLGHLTVVALPREVLMRDTPSGKGEDILDHLPQVARTDGVTARADAPGASLHFFRVFPEWDWMVVLSASTQEMRALRTAFLRNALIILAVSLIVGGIILVALTNSVVGPIQLLAKAAMGLSRGAFDAQLPTVKTNDEVAELTGTFDVMRNSLAAAHFDLERQTKELIAANASLNQEVADRKKAEKQLEDLNRDLEGLVEKRTRALARQAAELAAANRKLRELDELKSAFLTSVSHELRTPLTSVLGFTKMINKDVTRHLLPLLEDNSILRDKGNRVLANLAIIQHEGARLTRMINDFLDLAKIESGRMEWNDREVRIGEVLGRAANAVRGMFANNPGVELIVDLPDDLPPLHVDPDRIEQVFLNLLNNAAKFTARGSVTLSAGTDASGQLEIRVADTGEGMPPHALEMIFDKFHQIATEDTRTNKPKGTGLGLAICREIVSHYGGGIRVESEPGKGSVFTVTLPVSGGRAEVSPPPDA
ncbi:MAG: ATP-binding protein [Thermodesulfobacteriota bacterium]